MNISTFEKKKIKFFSKKFILGQKREFLKLHCFLLVDNSKVKFYYGCNLYPMAPHNQKYNHCVLPFVY